MHELHLMAQIVKAVEAGLQGADHARPSVVRLKVHALSHLLAHEQSSLQTAFVLAARGTRADGATLEIIPVEGEGWCPRCNRGAVATGSDAACSACGGPMAPAQTEPEVILHELVVEE